MQIGQVVRCPNCGDFAERQWLNDCSGSTGDHVLQTACPACDYLMVMSFPAGRVIEAYAPGQSSGPRQPSGPGRANAPGQSNGGDPTPIQPRFLVHTR